MFVYFSDFGSWGGEFFGQGIERCHPVLLFFNILSIKSLAGGAIGRKEGVHPKVIVDVY